MPRSSSAPTAGSSRFVERSANRVVLETVSDRAGYAVLLDSFAITSVTDEEALAAVLVKLGKKLDRLEQELTTGPFFLGAQMSLVDAAFLPALQRLFWSNDIHPALGVFDDRPRVARWWGALAEQDSVRGSAVDDIRQRFERSISRDRGGSRSVVGLRVAAQPA